MANETDPNRPKETPKPLSDDSTAKQPEIILPELIAALRSLGIDPSNPDRAAAVSKALEFSLTMFGGPLPPPSLLAEYNKAVPGLADRIVGWVEQQREFRQSQERFRSERSQNRMDRGQIIAATVAIVGLFLAAWVGVWGNVVAACIIAIASIGGPTAAVVLARRGVFSSRSPSANTHTSPPTPAPPSPAPTRQ